MGLVVFMLSNVCLCKFNLFYKSSYRELTKERAGAGNSGSNTRAVVEASIDRSRQRMGVNTLDMVQFHW